jgi:hypothetical protein
LMRALGEKVRGNEERGGIKEQKVIYAEKFSAFAQEEFLSAPEPLSSKMEGARWSVEQLYLLPFTTSPPKQLSAHEIPLPLQSTPRRSLFSLDLGTESLISNFSSSRNHPILTLGSTTSRVAQHVRRPEAGHCIGLWHYLFWCCLLLPWPTRHESHGRHVLAW